MDLGQIGHFFPVINILKRGFVKFKFSTVLIAGMFLCVSFQSEAQKGNILVEKGLAYLASTQSTSKGLDATALSSIDPAYNMGVFQSMGLSMISDMKTGALGVASNAHLASSIYPNPSSGIFNIRSSDAAITVINVQGQVVHNALIGGLTTLDLSHLGQGIYYIQLAGEKGLMNEKIAIK